MKKLLFLIIISLLIISPAKSQSDSTFAVIGYYPFFGAVSYPPSIVDYSSLTHIIHFSTSPSLTSPYFLPVISAAESLNVEFSWPQYPNLPPLLIQKTLIDSANKYGTKVLLGIAAVDYYGGNVEAMIHIVTDSSRTQTFVNSFVAYLDRKGYHGADFNWEWPASEYRDGFSRLMRLMRQRLDAIMPVGRRILTYASYFFFDTRSPVGGYQNVPLLNQYVDFVLPEFYGLGWAQMSSNFGYSAALHKPNVAGYDAGTVSDTNTYQGAGKMAPYGLWKAGFDKKKIAPGFGLVYSYSGVYTVGTPNGGVTWLNAGTSGWVNAFNQGLADPQHPTYGTTALPAAAEQWDSEAKVPFKRWTTGGTNYFMTYENSRSFQEKISWLKSNGYGGLMIYDLSSIYIAPTSTYGGIVNYSGDRQKLLKDIKSYAFSLIDTFRIMPLGNSITGGNWMAGWRKLLKDSLNVNGYRTDFVGSSIVNSENITDKEHEGIWNIMTWQQTARLLTILPQFNPHIVIVELGINDCANGSYTTAQIKTNMGKVLDSIWTLLPSAKIVFCSITPVDPARTSPPYQAWTAQPATLFQPYLELYNERVAQGKAIKWVDIYTILDSTLDLEDYAHLSYEGWPGAYVPSSTGGHKKVASAIYQQVKAFIEGYVPPPPPPLGETPIAPIMPNLTYPTIGASKVDTAFQFAWTKSVDTDTTHLQLSLSQTFASFVVDDSALIGTTRNISGLIKDTTYYCRIRTKNEWAKSIWTVYPIHFRTKRNPIVGGGGSGLDTLIYADALKTGWVDESWSNGVKNYSNTSPVYSGTYSIFDSCGSGSALGIAYAPVNAWTPAYYDVSIYDSVVFMAYPVGASAAIRFAFNSDSGALNTELWGLRKTSGVLTGNTWNRVSFPLNTLTGNHAISIMYFEPNTADYPKTFYIDDIRFKSVDAGDAAPDTIKGITLWKPLNNSISVERPVIMQWSPLNNDNIEYFYQVSFDTTMSDPIVDDSTTTPYAGITNTDVGTTHYYRVMAKSADTLSNEWSSVRAFRTVYCAYPAPFTPAEAATNVAKSPTLEFNAPVYLAHYYKFRVATDVDFNNVVWQDTSVNISKTVGVTLSSNTLYFWQGKAFSTTATDSSNWSYPSNFVTGGGLDTPTLLSPANSATDQSITVPLVWQSLGGAVQWYHLQIKAGGESGTIVFEDSTLLNPQRSAQGCTYDTTYYWRVRGRNSTENGAWSSYWSFTTTEKIGTPTGLIPNAISNASVQPTISWSELISGATSYQLQIDTLSNFSAVKKDTTVTTNEVQVKYLVPGRLYYSRVRAIKATDIGDWSETSVFTVRGWAVPAMPVLSIPAVDTTNTNTSMWFTWTVRDTDFVVLNYMQLRIDTTINSPLYSTNANAQYISGLFNSTVYYWRVASTNQQGLSSWTPFRKFTTKTAPDTTENPTVSSVWFNNATGQFVSKTPPAYQVIGGDTSGAYDPKSSLVVTLTGKGFKTSGGFKGFLFYTETNYIPTSASDTNGDIGNMSWDASYFYLKTSVGWARWSRTW